MLRLLAAWVLVNGLLIAPLWLSRALSDTPGRPLIALEAALIAGGMALLPPRPWRRALAWLAALTVVITAFVTLADLAFQVSLARPLNLFIDLYLVGAVYRLAVGNSGLLTTLAALVALPLVLAGMLFGLARLLEPGAVASPLPPRSRRVVPAVLGVLLVLGLAGAAVPPIRAWLATPVITLAAAQAEQLRATRRERELFASEMASAPDSYADMPGLLAELADADVLLTFIESYGSAALDDPELAAVVRPRLDALATRMAAAGIMLATGTLVSPTQGGQSWYAHGTMISGLWLENQLRYDLLMASDRATLVDDFRRAGHRTAAVMPAITMSWPEGIRLRYDDVYTRSEIPYAGPPLYWVSVPDQFTLSFLERTLRSAAAGRALFIETALVSSHAPWTPILPVLAWDSIGDGSVFAPFGQEGHPPEELWIDTGELRRGYARSLDYSLQVVTGFAERVLDAEPRTLLIVLGDHQAAPWVTGAVSSTVPVHVMTTDPALLEPFLAWGFAPGALPSAERAPHRMDEFRDWFVRAFSDAKPEAKSGRAAVGGDGGG